MYTHADNSGYELTDKLSHQVVKQLNIERLTGLVH